MNMKRSFLTIIDSIVLCLTQTCALPLNQLGDIWSIEVNRPTLQIFFQLYKLQFQFFFLITRLKKCVWIDNTLFRQIKRQNIQWAVENLLAEILA